MEGESGATGSNIDELHSSDIQGHQLKVKLVVLEDSVMKFILRISKEMKWKVKVVLLEIKLMNFILWDIQGDQMESESGVSRRIIEELHSSNIQGDQMEGESDVTPNIIDELHS